MLATIYSQSFNEVGSRNQSDAIGAQLSDEFCWIAAPPRERMRCQLVRSKTVYAEIRISLAGTQKGRLDELIGPRIGPDNNDLIGRQALHVGKRKHLLCPHEARIVVEEDNKCDEADR